MSARQLDKSSKFRFYLRLFFDLLDVACVNAFIVCERLENTELMLKDFKLLIAERMIGSFGSRKNSLPLSRSSKRSRKYFPGPDPPSHLLIFLESRHRCTVYSKKGQESRTFASCSTCSVWSCFLKDKDCFAANHQESTLEHPWNLLCMIICSLKLNKKGKTNFFRTHVFRKSLAK